MSRIEIQNLSTTSASAAFADALNRAAAGVAISPRIAFGSYAELFSVMMKSLSMRI